MKTTEKDIKVIGYPFVDHVDQRKRPTLSLDLLKQVYTPYHGSRINMINNGVYKLMGYKYDFKPYLKKYLFKFYGEWHEGYAPNKTLLRQAIGCKIDKIIDYPN